MNLSEFLELISTVGLLEGTNFWNGLLIILALLTGLLTCIKVILMFTYKFLKFIRKSLQNQKFKTILANYQDEGLVKSFQLQDFEIAKRDYIVPNCSNIDPTNNDQFNANVGVHQNDFDAAVVQQGNSYDSKAGYDAVYGPNSNTSAEQIVEGAGGKLPNIPGAYGQNYGKP